MFHDKPKSQRENLADAAGLVNDDCLLKIDNLSLSYGQTNILNKINLSISQGEVITVLGLNGGGKTSLAKILVGIIKGFTGTVRYFTNPVVGYLPQHFNVNTLIPMTVEYFLLSSFVSYNQAYKIEDVLSQVDIQRLLKKQIAEISEGELQIVLLARCLLMRPNFIILDEPVSSMDVRARNSFYKLINQLVHDMPKTSILMTSHDLRSVMAESHRIICLNKSIRCEGKAEDLIQHESFIEMFGVL